MDQATTLEVATQPTSEKKTRTPRPKQPTKAELQKQLAEALARAEAAEAVLRAEPRRATPGPNGYPPEALLAPAEGVIRLWVMTASEGYRLRLCHVGEDGIGWAMSKWSDGTTYHLFEATGGEIECDCPGFTAYGAQCAGGKGCKHKRFLKAIRQVVDPGV
jgi:hypothetical protein